MDTLTEGAQIIYQLSDEDVENLNSYMAAHPEQHAPGTPAVRGQRVPATVVMTLGPKQAGPERLAVRLESVANPPGKAYHVGADDLVYTDGAWYKPQP